MSDQQDKRIVITMPGPLLKHIDEAAEVLYMSRAAYIRQALAGHLNREKELKEQEAREREEQNKYFKNPYK